SAGPPRSWEDHISNPHGLVERKLAAAWRVAGCDRSEWHDTGAAPTIFAHGQFWAEFHVIQGRHQLMQGKNLRMNRRHGLARFAIGCQSAGGSPGPQPTFFAYIRLELFKFECNPLVDIVDGIDFFRLKQVSNSANISPNP